MQIVVTIGALYAPTHCCRRAIVGEGAAHNVLIAARMSQSAIIDPFGLCDCEPNAHPGVQSGRW